jgi:hypothetical protein
MARSNMRKRRRWGRWVLLLLALVLAGAAIHFRPLGVIGSGYAAQQTCACLFIAGRELESCRRDLEPLAQKIISITPGDHEVTARALGVIRARARYQDGFGCALVE